MNAIRFTPSYQGNGGLGFKLNYERNITTDLIGFVSAEGNVRYSKGIGIGMKYKFLKYGDFEGLVGLEMQHIWQDNTSLGYPDSRFLILKPSIELRYNVSKTFFIGIDATYNYNLENNCLQNNRNRPRIGLSVGYKF
jgi:hypothetical protein